MPISGSRKNDRGSRIAIAISVVNPGSAPTNIPSISPMLIIANVSQRNARPTPSTK